MMNWKILLTLFLIIAFFPLVSKFSKKNIIPPAMPSKITNTQDDKEFVYQKDILTNKGIIIFQYESSGVDKFKNTFQYLFKESIRLKIPPTIHSKQPKLFVKNILVEVSSEMHSALNSSTYNLIQCKYFADQKIKSRLQLEVCSLLKFNNGKFETLKDDFFELEKKKEITVSNNDILRVRANLDQSLEEDGLGYYLETTFDFSF